MSGHGHTPGPWEVMPGNLSPLVCVKGDKGWPIAVVVSGHTIKGANANQHLIAAAPDLLAALKECLPFCKGHRETPAHVERYERVCAALAKARGR